MLWSCYKIIRATIILATLIFLGVYIASLEGCAGMSLPNRDHPNCKIKWSDRPVCIDASDCSDEFRCAFRGNNIGRCTYVDCCNPWRNRGYDFTSCTNYDK